jgi:cell division protease FtsH
VRQDILSLHARGRPTAPGVDLALVAQRTPGFTGADLANVINEAALLSVRFSRAEIGMAELDEAVMRVTSGPQRRGHLLTPEERQRVAYHESGHAVVAAALGRLPEMHRVSIMSREDALGQTAFSRRMKERALLTRGELFDELVIAMAGGAAEETVLGEPSTGSRFDLVRATELAQMMVGVFGMSSALGKVTLLHTDGAGFLGEQMVPAELATGRVLEDVHAEVRQLVAGAEVQARAILHRNLAQLTELTDRLLVVETLHGPELETLLAGAEAGPRLPPAAAVVSLDGHGTQSPVR